MISSGKVVAVSNTGPLVSALQCGRVDLLKQYFSVIYVTASELGELEEHGWEEDVHQLMAEGFVVAEVLTVREKEQAEQIARSIAADPISGDSTWQSHLPEAEAMALMQERGHLMIEQILLDEKAARKAAQLLGLPLTGFPGVVGRAGLDGLVTQHEIRQLLKACQQQGTHYSNALIEAVAQTYGR